MFPEQLKKILNLIKKTGDRVVIFDANNPGDSYVVMDIDRYASMVTDQKELVQNIPVETLETEISPVNTVKSVENENLTEEDLTDKINREISLWKNRENTAYLAEDDKPKKAWTIPSQVKNKAQEVE